MVDDRPYSPGLEGVLAGETALSYIDGAAGRLLYRGYSIGDLVRNGSYAAVAELLWTGEWNANARLPLAPVPPAVLTALRALPQTTKPMDALRTAVSAWGASQDLAWPPTPEQARSLTAFSPSALAAFARLRNGEGSLGQLLNNDALSKSVTSATSNLDAITGRISKGEGTAGKLITDAELYNRLNSMADRLDKLAASLNQGEGTAGQLLHDKQLYENMNTTVTEVHNLVKDIRADPKKYLNVRVSIF